MNENSEKSSSKTLNNGNARGDNKNKRKQEVDDPEVREFLDLHERGKSKFWSNNDISIAPTSEETGKEKVLVKKADQPVISNGSEPKKVKRSSDTAKTKKSKAVAPSDDVSDMEYFKSRIKKNLSDSDSDNDTDSSEDEASDAAEDDDGEADADGHDADIRNFPVDGIDKDDDGDDMEVEDDGKVAQELKADSDDVLDTGRLFVRNLPYTTTYCIFLFILFSFITYVLFILVLFIVYISDFCQ